MTAPVVPRGGRIVYHTTILDAAGEPTEADSFERALLRRNLVQQRTVTFDGRSARIDEVNTDHGVHSPCVRLYGPGRVTYGKRLHCISISLQLPPPPALGGGGEPAVVEPAPGERVIAGRRCRRVRYVDGARQLAIDYTDEVTFDDPTGAVVRFPGVPGTALAWEELAGTSWRTRVEVTSVSPRVAEHYALPSVYRPCASLDEGRARDRAALEGEATTAPPGQPAAFAGRWRWDRGDAELDITLDGARLRVRTRSPAGTTDEDAFVLGRRLAVEEPPNLRLYELDEAGQRLTLRDDATFRFHRV